MKKRFSLKHLFFLVAFAGLSSAGLRQYLNWRIDYIEPPANPNVRELTKEDIRNLKRGAEFYQTKLKKEYPTQGRQYWEKQIANLKRGMVYSAIRRYLVYASPGYSLMASDGSQISYFAVDAQFGAAVRFENLMGGDGRIVEPVCIFEHECELDEYGGIAIDRLPNVKDRLVRLLDKKLSDKK